MGEAEVAALLVSGDLERVEADPVTAGREIAAATRHVESASRLSEDGEDIAMHVEAFDQLRRLRNQSQYDGLEVEPSEVREIVVHARAIVAAVSEDPTR